jgi:hypothetical protein
MDQPRFGLVCLTRPQSLSTKARDARAGLRVWLNAAEFKAEGARSCGWNWQGHSGRECNGQCLWSRNFKFPILKHIPKTPQLRRYSVVTGLPVH